MKLSPTASYSLRRLALFGATLVLCAAVMRGASFLLVLVVATLISGVLSYFLLAGSRERMAQVVAGRVQRISTRLDSGAAAEDAALDAAEQRSHSPEQGTLKPE